MDIASWVPKENYASSLRQSWLAIFIPNVSDSRTWLPNFIWMGEGASLSFMLQLAIKCIVEITCNSHCIQRIRQTILIQNVVQDDTTNVSLMFVCKWKASGKHGLLVLCLRLSRMFINQLLLIFDRFLEYFVVESFWAMGPRYCPGCGSDIAALKTPKDVRKTL